MADEIPQMIGQAISHYRVISTLGRGGMGWCISQRTSSFTARSRSNSSPTRKAAPTRACSERRRRPAASTIRTSRPLSGRYDAIFPEQRSQVPFFEMLGTPADRKRRVVYDSGHNLPPSEMMRETLDWFDWYLGPVRK